VGLDPVWGERERERERGKWSKLGWAPPEVTQIPSPGGVSILTFWEVFVTTRPGKYRTIV
jgi:hypothetical protein